MITIREVAEIAGVSKSTVSRVLNDNGYVSESTRKKVEEVISRCNYSPSAVAVNLSKRGTNTIGVLIPEFDNTFFGEILKGITEISDQKDLSIICCDTANDVMKEDRALLILEQQRVRGLIITPAREYSAPEDVTRLRERFNRLRIPIVVVDRHLEKIRLDGVFYENFESGYIAASELIKAGNRKLGIITGDLRLRIARDRYHGFLHAIEDAQLELNRQFILEGDFSVDTAYKLARQMFESGTMPEGIVTCNTFTSLAFLKAARECDVGIGKDIAVIGIDHIQVVDILGYNFSCVTRDVHEMGRVAMRMLCDRIENETAQRTIHMIPCKLVLKGSERRIPLRGKGGAH